MAASQRQLQRYIYLRNSKLHIFYISYCDGMLKKNEFLWIFLGKGFREKSNHTELALNFIQKRHLVQKNYFPFIKVESQPVN